MTTFDNYDAVIIGAGVIGAATALELSRNGYKTLSIDKNPEAGYGSTSNSCAIIRVHYSTEHDTAFAYEGYFYWKNWKEYLGNKKSAGLSEFRKTGCLIMKTEGNGNLEKVIANAESLSIPHEHWNPKKIKSRLSIYDLRKYGPPKRVDDENFGEPTGNQINGAVFFPTAGYINDPKLATQNIQDAAESWGASFLFNQNVIEIPVSNNCVEGVVLEDGTRIESSIVVNVAGPHSSVINKMVGADKDMNIQTRALKQEVAHIPAPEGFDFEKDGMVISDNDIGVYCRPETGNHVLAGSEDPECDLREWVDPDDYDRNFTEQASTQAMRMAQRMSGLKMPRRMRGAVDLYDVSDDWLPIYDCSSIEGFYMACGSSGNQFKNAPVAGKIMAKLVEYCESGNDHDHSPMQFQLSQIDYPLNTGNMSRLRKINPNSSFSVLG
ncbi:MAG: FAD-dependent oxidoreductase [SAR324 cluster bacterium]|jgi:sarcosine oxidase subunit beta|nr:FAD-dependent oxidoreductase [Deltaproteobacteria bacterium]MDP6246544.1 FAD-dependent oxidoreductase [SAR324 cluster bacterium]MDP6465424.1 FAD-dependent oxidoreductase [SAR324 cluster bacterium]MDP7140045.1 FAD-dependent oxidoreductase [SAR324 cluster bacterium]MDP7336176.1 FAD-dependent oxidoreductase [SAR324 cluster bacterium]|tara:strand:+ start:3540 stop:4850 length:1311 start_codon:yes stop_codon:yes gene_type:complete